MSPAASSAHETKSPADTPTAAAPPGRETGAGGTSTIPDDPLPSAPDRPEPQHVTSPPASTAHVWKSPALMAMAVPGDGRVIGDGGVMTSALAAPFPNWPLL